MSAKNYFKDGGSWIKGELVVGEKAFCIYNTKHTECCNGGIPIIANSWKIGPVNMVLENEFNSKALYKK